MSQASTTAPVDTKSVAGRRTVSYASVDDIVADAERLLAGGYQQLGNWSLGQMTEHIARAYRLGLDGSDYRAPFFVRWIARFLYKDKAVGGPMRPGFQAPPAFARMIVAAPSTADAAGVDSLRQALGRWTAEPQRHPHPFFGHLTPDEWHRIMLRHAEMHMSFLVAR